MGIARFGWVVYKGDFGREPALRLVIERDAGAYSVEFDRNLKARHTQAAPYKEVINELAQLVDDYQGDFVNIVTALRGRGYEYVEDLLSSSKSVA